MVGLTEEEFESNEAMKNYITDDAGVEIGIIPADIYGDGVVNTEDVYTPAGIVGFTVRADLDEETIYRIIIAYWESATDALDTNPWLAGIALFRRLRGRRAHVNRAGSG